MRMLNRNKQRLYIASQIMDDELVDSHGNRPFDKPFLLCENLASVDGKSEKEEYGDRVRNMYKSVVMRKKWEGRIKENDVAYLDGITPDGEAQNGAYANYRIESVRNTSLNMMTIYFEKLP